ncbi:MAG: EamA family transporter [Candidatus Krumholzibacteria bacterium]|nr:EamA family transporter [Candidatus Krumholzibacteria bacterium]
MLTPPRDGARTWRVVLAFAAIYLVWGSTYLAIRYAVDTLPPFLMAGTRALVAGTILLTLTWRRGSAVRWLHWRSALVAAAFMFLGGHGLLSWAQQHVPSSMAALVEATIPVWIVVLRMIPRRLEPDPLTIGAITIGFLGVAILASAGQSLSGSEVGIVDYAALLVSSICWSVGSLYARRAPMPKSLAVATGMQLFAGGVLVVLVGGMAGEWGRFDVTQVSRLSLLSLLYLTVLGSLVAFSAYSWLLRRTEPALVGTYAFVNPLVALVLGALIAGERLQLMGWVGGTLIMAAAAIMHGVQSGTFERSVLRRWHKTAGVRAD